MKKSYICQFVLFLSSFVLPLIGNAKISDKIASLTPVKEFTESVINKKKMTLGDYGNIKIQSKEVTHYKIIEDTGKNSKQINMLYSPTNDNGQTYAISFLAKADGRNFLRLSCSYTNKTKKGSVSKNGTQFDLQTGQAEARHGNGFIEALCDDLGNGWYHCYYSFTASLERHDTYDLIFFLTLREDPNQEEHKGDGTSGVLISDIKLFNKDYL
jgi:hypothetical protein